MLKINILTVQQQFGTCCDGGPLAIAFTLHLAMGDDPQHILFHIFTREYYTTWGSLNPRRIPLSPEFWGPKGYISLVIWVPPVPILLGICGPGSPHLGVPISCTPVAHRATN